MLLGGSAFATIAANIGRIYPRPCGRVTPPGAAPKGLRRRPRLVACEPCGDHQADQCRSLFREDGAREHAKKKPLPTTQALNG